MSVVVCIVPFMERRTLPQAVAGNVEAAISASGALLPVVAQAADLTISQLTDRLSGAVEFNTAELVQVGGFLHVRPSEFLIEAAA